MIVTDLGFSRDQPNLGSKREEMHKSFLKLTISLFLDFLCFLFSYPWKLWPQLDCKYESFTFVVFILLKGKMKPSSYGLMEKFAFHAKCLEGSN